MNMRVFKQVPRIVFGAGSLSRLSEVLPAKSSQDPTYKIFVVDHAHKETGVMSKVQVEETDLLFWVDSTHEPSVDTVDSLRDQVLKTKSTLPLSVIGIGGGCAMDVAKGIAVMLTNEGKASQYQGWDLVKKPAVHKIGVPTISGSGSEASRTAVFYSQGKKFGINSDFSMFDAIILDSSLIGTVPRDSAFYTAMDCYIHSVESLQGTMINELAKAYATSGLNLCRKYFLEGGNADELMVASYMGGASIVNSEVGVCHALSYGLSLELGFHHGIANCIAFNVLDDYYGSYVEEFRGLLKRNKISLPEKVCARVNDEMMERMIAMTFRMEKPLTNALGPNWKDKLTREKVIDLYRRM